MKYRGRSASDVYEEDLPKEETLVEEIEVENFGRQNSQHEDEFKEAAVEVGDQSMPAKPAPSRPQSSKLKPLNKLKIDQPKISTVPQPVKKQSGPLKKVKQIENKPKAKLLEQKQPLTQQASDDEFKEQSLDVGDQAMP